MSQPLEAFSFLLTKHSLPRNVLFSTTTISFLETWTRSQTQIPSTDPLFAFAARCRSGMSSEKGRAKKLIQHKAL